MAKLTTEEFIKKAREVHGDKYDYSKVEYVNTQTKVTIICPEHGEYSQVPYSHLGGKGCPQCSGRIKLNTQEFITRAREVHGDKYDYSKVEYVNNRTPVTIICPEHGEFWQRPDLHLQGKGCPICGINSRAKLRTRSNDSFVEEAIKIHGNRYDYTKVNYVNSQTKVTIICPEHGEFLQTPDIHLQGSGCPQCGIVSMAKSRTKLQDTFIEEARKVHGDKYDYSKVNYVNNRTKVTIICHEHGVFLQAPANHLGGRGCPQCGIITNAKSRTKLQDTFIGESRKVHGDKYDYSKVEYVDYKTPVTIICPIHGEFQQNPSNHLCGNGCPTCGIEKNRKSFQMPQEEFVRRAQLVHGNKYDYSKVEYVNNQTKVTIICPKHGEFQQAPAGHLGGQGCPKCGNERGHDSRKKHQEDFIEEAKKVWGDKYDYSLVNYVNNKIAINVICKEHGVFSPLPNNFLRGHGCPQCGILANSAARANSKEYFICKAKEIHGDKYDYSKVKYVSSKTPVTIICPIHGEFQQKPNAHVDLKQGCPQCYGNFKSTTEEFIEKARKVHGEKYDYSLVEYDGNKKPVKIICPTHGVFEQSPNAHLRGSGCLECSGVRLLTTKEFIILARQVHGDTYDYSLVDYQGNKKKVKIVCPKHGCFEQVPNSYLSGRGCPHCTESKGEESVRLYLKKNNINFIAYHSFDDCRNINPLSFDFYLPDCNVCIEYQGLQHYEVVEAWGGQEGFEYRQHLDNIKRQYCKDNGIRLIEIRYDEDVEKVLKKALQGLNVPRKDSI